MAIRTVSTGEAEVPVGQHLGVVVRQAPRELRAVDATHGGSRLHVRHPELKQAVVKEAEALVLASSLRIIRAILLRPECECGCWWEGAPCG